VLYGTPAEVRAKLTAYVDGGVHTPVIALVPPPGADLLAIVRALGPGPASSGLRGAGSAGSAETGATSVGGAEEAPGSRERSERIEQGVNGGDSWS
jgi:hypothetical protein